MRLNQAAWKWIYLNGCRPWAEAIHQRQEPVATFTMRNQTSATRFLASEDENAQKGSLTFLLLLGFLNDVSNGLTPSGLVAGFCVGDVSKFYIAISDKNE